MARVLLLFALLISACPGQTPLVHLDSKTLGDPQFDIQITELQRDAKTSTIEVIHRKGGPTGSTMIVVRGMYEVAKARHAAYFAILKEWSDAGGGHRYLVGFTNSTNADLKTVFGDAYAEPDASGTIRGYLSVAQFATLFEIPRPIAP